MSTLNFVNAVNTITPKVRINAKNFKDQGSYPIISQEAKLISGYWDDENDVMHFNHPVVVYGDHTRVVKYVDFDFAVGADGVKIFQPIDDLDAKYLYYWLLANPVESLGYARHFRLLKEKVIYLPSPEEQRQIIIKLDAAFEKIDRAKELTKQRLLMMDSLKQSMLYQGFSENTDR